jgi:hypothetical protein
MASFQWPITLPSSKMLAPPPPPEMPAQHGNPFPANTARHKRGERSFCFEAYRNVCTVELMCARQKGRGSGIYGAPLRKLHRPQDWHERGRQRGYMWNRIRGINLENKIHTTIYLFPSECRKEKKMVKTD